MEEVVLFLIRAHNNWLTMWLPRFCNFCPLLYPDFFSLVNKMCPFSDPRFLCSHFSIPPIFNSWVAIASPHSQSSFLLTHLSIYFNLHLIPNCSCQGSSDLPLARLKEYFHFSPCSIPAGHLNQLVALFLKLFFHFLFFFLPCRKFYHHILWLFVSLESYAWMHYKIF